MAVKALERSVEDFMDVLGLFLALLCIMNPRRSDLAPIQLVLMVLAVGDQSPVGDLETA